MVMFPLIKEIHLREHQEPTLEHPSSLSQVPEVILDPIPLYLKRLKDHKGLFGPGKGPNNIQMFHPGLIKTYQISLPSSCNLSLII